MLSRVQLYIPTRPVKKRPGSGPAASMAASGLEISRNSYAREVLIEKSSENVLIKVFGGIFGFLK